MINWGTIIIIALICGAITAVIGQRKNIPASESFLWGAFLGVVGVVIVACMKPRLPDAPDGMRAVQCPRCNAAQNVERDASSYDCWQCHTRNGVKSPEPKPGATVGMDANGRPIRYDPNYGV